MGYLSDSELDDIEALNKLVGLGPQARLVQRLVEGCRDRNRLERTLKCNLMAMVQKLDEALETEGVAL